MIDKSVWDRNRCPVLLRGKSSYAALALLALTAAACGGGGGPKTVPANAVAIVGDAPITRAEVGSIVAARRTSGQLTGRGFPSAGTAEFRAARNGIVQELVVDAELEQRARSDFGVEISDQQVDQKVAEMRRREYGDSEAGLEAALQQEGISRAELRLRLQQQLLGAAVFARLGSKISVSDAEIERYYRSHLKGYQEPAKRPVSHILVETRPEAERLERKLKAGADFAAIARRYSTDTATALAGGRIEGGIVRGEAAAAIEKAAFSLGTNAISRPIHTKYGWEILSATAAVTPGKTTPLSAVRDAIETELTVEKRRNELRHWVAETRAAYAKKVAYAPGFRPAT